MIDKQELKAQLNNCVDDDEAILYKRELGLYDYTYTCPVCNNQVELTGCPFDDKLTGQCKFCNLRIEILVDDYKKWKEAKSDVDK